MCITDFYKFIEFVYYNFINKIVKKNNTKSYINCYDYY